MLPPLSPKGFEYFRMPIGFDSLENVRDIIGLEQLYCCLTKLGMLSYFHNDNGTAGGIEPEYWDTVEGREVLSSSGIVSVRGERSLVVVAIPHDLIRNPRALSDAAETESQLASDAAVNAPKPISEADIIKAISLLRSESVTESMAKPQRRDFLRQAFPEKRITEPVFRRIEKAVPGKIGRRKKSDGQI